jgi:hypothetical protein
MRALWMIVMTATAVASGAALALAAPDVPAPVAKVSADPLIGKWRVDLTASPAEGLKGRYYTDMVIESVEGDRITGTFYGSRIENGRINRSWGAVRFAFRTHDGGGVPMIIRVNSSTDASSGASATPSTATSLRSGRHSPEQSRSRHGDRRALTVWRVAVAAPGLRAKIARSFRGDSH